jgi:hypothetical protein
VGVTIQDNCGGNLAYTVTAVSGDWITSPQVNTQGTNGTLTIKFNTSGLSSNTYDGKITLDLGQYGTKVIPVTVNVTNPNPNAVLLKNFEIQYFSYAPGQVRYFIFYENSNKKLGNLFSLYVSQMDMTQGTGLGDIDMIVKYAGQNCEFGMPSMTDYDAAKAGTIISGENNLYFRLSSDAFETVRISSNPEGCYYVMVINADDISESRISIKYEDSDSN